MADELDANVYADNDDNISCTPTISTFNATTGALAEAALTGRLDGKYFLSAIAATLPTTDPIHLDLVVNLVEAGSTGVYYGVQQGSVKNTHLAALADDQTIYRHVVFGTDYHRAVAVKYRKARES